MALHDHLEGAFGEAQPWHFEWQTRCPYVADSERTLVRAAFEPLGRKVLDLGCGEGATFVHLGRTNDAVGVDLFEDKLAFARQQLPGCEFVAAPVEDLPFDAGRFDHVLARDIIHHLDEPERFVQEAWRVLEPGGRLDVLEPCRYSPLIAMHALLIPAERGELRSTEGFLRQLLEPRFAITGVRRHQALPIHRVVFHPTMGSPRIAEHALARAAVGAVERLAEHIVPRFAWSYMHVAAVKASSP